MTNLFFKLLLATLALVLVSCASEQKTRELNYCPWSQDSSRWKAHEPDWSKAFISSLFSQSDVALQHVTGGQLTRENVYDIQGHVIHVVSNNYGIQTVEDLTSRCYLTPMAYGQRMVGAYNYQDLVKMKVIK